MVWIIARSCRGEFGDLARQVSSHLRCGRFKVVVGRAGHRATVPLMFQICTVTLRKQTKVLLHGPIRHGQAARPGPMVPDRWIVVDVIFRCIKRITRFSELRMQEDCLVLAMMFRHRYRASDRSKKRAAFLWKRLPHFVPYVNGCKLFSDSQEGWHSWDVAEARQFCKKCCGKRLQHDKMRSRASGCFHVRCAGRLREAQPGNVEAKG